MQARRLAKRSSLGSRRGSAALQPPGPAPAPAREGALPGLPPPAPAPAPESWRPPLPPPRNAGTEPPCAGAAAAASSPVLLLLGEEDEDEEGGSRRRRGLGRAPAKPRGGAEEEDDDDEDEDEEVVVEVVDGDDDDEDGDERFVALGPGRALPKGPARGALKVRAGCGGARGTLGRGEGTGPGLRRGAGCGRDRRPQRPAREGCVRRPRGPSEGTDEAQRSGPTPSPAAAPPFLQGPPARRARPGWVAGKGRFSRVRRGTWRRDEVGAGLRLVGTGEVGGREVIFLPRKYEGPPSPYSED